MESNFNKKEIISLKKVKSETQVKHIYFNSNQKVNKQIETNINFDKRLKFQEQIIKKQSQILNPLFISKEIGLKYKQDVLKIENLRNSNSNVKQSNKEKLKKICLKSQIRSSFETDQQSSTQQSSLEQVQYINQQYQLKGETSFKKVQFSEKTIQIDPRRQSFLQKKKNSSTRVKSPSILKNSSKLLNQSIYSETQRSYSIQNSFQVRRKVKFNNSTDNNLNKVTKQKYQKILNSLHKQSNFNIKEENKKVQFLNYSATQNIQNQKQIDQNFKFKDELFPAVYSSLFRVIGNKKQPKRGKNIKWLRLPQLFKHRKCKVFNNYSQTYSQIIIFKQSQYCSDIILGCFNAIKNNKILLQEIFQNQQELNPFGLYLVKICIGTSWKYIIIDDFIPVVKNQINQQVYPAFLNVQLQDQQVNIQNPLYIWPFLLQKAYASYYSCYEALKIGTETDFLSQITDSAFQKIQLSKLQELNKEQKNEKLKAISLTLKQKNVIFIGYSDEDLPYVPLKYQNYHNQTLQQQFLTYYDPLSNYLPFKIRLVESSKLFSSIFIYKVKEFQFSTTCLIYPPKVSNKKQKNKLQLKNVTPHQNLKILHPNFESTSIRSFSILKYTNCSIIISQKQNRFYMAHKYIWNRVFILVKEYNNSFRWIFGQYSNSKSITFKTSLNAGEYYIIVMPEWKQEHNRQITVIIHSDNQFVNFQRKIYNPKERIIQQGCMDLAQREGKLIQINKFICSYNLLYQKCGLIIENICNQRPKGQVTVMRSISGLKSKSQIFPINNEFYVQVQKQAETQKHQNLAYNIEDQKKNSSKILFLKEEIQVQIQSLDSYTVVLKMKGGVDRKFFKAFKF